MGEKSIKFHFNGRELTGQDGDTIATALLRNGVRVFDRSIKRRRKRGASCLEGFCMSCALEVDGEPDVVTCRTKLESGMKVKSQLAYPSPSFDLRLMIQQPAFELFGSDLYYRLFTKPAWAQHLWIRFLAEMSGRARLHSNHSSPDPLPFNVVKTQVLVVGAGVAGIASAREASAAGLDVLLVDRGNEPGGWWSRWKSIGTAPDSFQPLNEPLTKVQVHFLSQTTLIGLYEDQTALAVSDSAAYRIHYDVAIIAAGCYPNLLTYQNSDEPGHLPVQGVLRAAAETGWAPKSAVLLDADGEGAAWKQALESRGVQVQLRRVNHGGSVLEEIRAGSSGNSSSVRFSNGETLRGEVVCWSAGWRPRDELIRQNGGTMTYRASENIFVPNLKDNVFIAENHLAAGGCAGVFGFRSAQQHGTLAGAAAASRLSPSAQMRYRQLAKDWTLA